jgi:U32 family peptidase
MTSKAFERALENLSKVSLSNFQSIRVQDPGALYYLMEKFPEIKIQLNLETGNHNLRAIRGWVDLVGERLEKIILSSELNREKLGEYINAFKSHDFTFELLGLGKILLFYTPWK